MIKTTKDMIENSEILTKAFHVFMEDIRAGLQSDAPYEKSVRARFVLSALDTIVPAIYRAGYSEGVDDIQNDFKNVMGF